MRKPKIIGTGLSGLIGSRVKELLGSRFEIVDLSRETGFDITNHLQLEKTISNSPASWVWHLAAYTDVQQSEKDRNLGQNSMVWKVNVQTTEFIVKLLKKLPKRLLYLSTDYVFSGRQKTPYLETDKPNPQGWYAQTKYEGEKWVSQLGQRSLIIRSANPYRANPVSKIDFVHKILKNLSNHEMVYCPSDQIFCPTFVDDIARGIDLLVSWESDGIYHLAGSAISPYDSALTIAKIYKLPSQHIQPVKFTEFIKSRAPIPQNAALSSQKINQLGIYPLSFSEGLRELKEQESLSA